VHPGSACAGDAHGTYQRGGWCLRARLLHARKRRRREPRCGRLLVVRSGQPRTHAPGAAPLASHGAQGFFIDGCTSPRVYCPWGRVCVVNTANNIDTRQHYGHWMTQNARVRVFNSSGQVRWQHDKSCGNTNMCSNYDYYGKRSVGWGT
jgi:hypothetical protein